jgi:putative resolvase
VKLSAWAKQEGIHYMTAWRWWRDGKLPVPVHQAPSGTIIVEIPERSAAHMVVCTRVSSAGQAKDLDCQVARVTAWATERGHPVDAVMTEIGSGLNVTRRKLLRLLADPQVSTIRVEHRDRLARCGVEALKAALAAQGRRIMVVDPEETADDLVRDMIDVLTSFCARLYGRRGARNRALVALRTAKRGA